MLRITNVEEIEHMLLRLPDLVRQQAERDYRFYDNAQAWLVELEHVFVENKLYQAASVAALRSELVAAAQGQLPSGVALKGVPSRARVKSVVAAQALQRAAVVASSVVQDNRRRFSEAEAIAQQLIAVALPRGLVVRREPNISNTTYLVDLRDRLVKADLEPAVLHLEGLVGPNDTLILLDRALVLRRAVVSEVPNGPRSGAPRPAGAPPEAQPSASRMIVNEVSPP